MNYRLLLVQDAPRRRSKTLADSLRARGYSMDTASDADFAVDTGFAGTFDLIMIDATDPPAAALEICADLRCRNVRMPILMLACRDLARDRIAAFKAGADDYITEQVDLDEFEVRIQALLRRSMASERSEISSYEFGGMTVNFRTSEITRRQARIELSELENRLLLYLIEHRGRTVSRTTLLQQVWGYRRAPFTRTVDVHILRLRQKIENDSRKPKFIVTVHGFGYRFEG